MIKQIESEEGKMVAQKMLCVTNYQDLLLLAIKAIDLAEAELDNRLLLDKCFADKALDITADIIKLGSLHPHRSIS